MLKLKLQLQWGESERCRWFRCFGDAAREIYRFECEVIVVKAGGKGPIDQEPEAGRAGKESSTKDNHITVYTSK